MDGISELMGAFERKEWVSRTDATNHISVRVLNNASNSCNDAGLADLLLVCFGLVRSWRIRLDRRSDCWWQMHNPQRRVVSSSSCQWTVKTGNIKRLSRDRNLIDPQTRLQNERLRSYYEASFMSVTTSRRSQRTKKKRIHDDGVAAITRLSWTPGLLL